MKHVHATGDRAPLTLSISAGGGNTRDHEVHILIQSEGHTLDMGWFKSEDLIDAITYPRGNDE